MNNEEMIEMDSERMVKKLKEIGQEKSHDEMQFPFQDGQTPVVLVHDLTYVACKELNDQDEIDSLRKVNSSAFRVWFYIVPTNQISGLPLGESFPCN